VEVTNIRNVLMHVLKWHCRNTVTCQPSDYFWL